jgi:hypothetical protein
MKFKAHQNDQAIKQQQSQADDDDKSKSDDMGQGLQAMGDEISQAIKEVAGLFMQASEKNSQAIVKAVTAPKRVVYHPETGRPMGAESVQ